MVDFDPLEESDVEYLRAQITKHAEYTDSSVAKGILENWEESLEKFIKVIPVDYKRALALIADEENVGE